MKLATTTGDFLGYTDSQAESLRHIRRAGFKYADYNFHCDYRSGCGIYAGDYDSYVSSIAEKCDKIGIKLVQAHAPMGDPLLDGEFLAATLNSINAAGKWNIPNIVVHSGYAPGLSKKECFEKNKEFFMPLLECAEKYGVNVLVENFNRMCIADTYWIDDAPSLLEMVEYVNHPLFHAVWDTGHGNMQELPQDEALRMLGSHVRALHVQDNMGDVDLHLAPFLGTLNMDEVMCGLKDIGYEGYFTFEVGKFFTAAELKHDYKRSELLRGAPIELRDAFERYLYELGKCVLEKYGVFEE